MSYILSPEGTLPSWAGGPPTADTGSTRQGWKQVDQSLRKALASLKASGSLSLPAWKERLGLEAAEEAAPPARDAASPAVGFLRSGERAALERDLVFPWFFEDLARLPFHSLPERDRLP